ncbi:MAG: hypothetical protein GY950_31310 [bacterium]|nr:hypothetical protein [bacterium]
MALEKKRYVNHKFFLRVMRALRGKNKKQWKFANQDKANRLIFNPQNGINNYAKT